MLLLLFLFCCRCVCSVVEKFFFLGMSINNLSRTPFFHMYVRINIRFFCLFIVPLLFFAVPIFARFSLRKGGSVCPELEIQRNI